MLRTGGPNVPPMRVLLSFHYCRGVSKRGTRYLDLDAWTERCFEPGTNVDLFADSGGFSAHSTGADVELEDYARWVDRFGDHFTTIVALDAIRDPAGAAAVHADRYAACSARCSADPTSSTSS